MNILIVDDEAPARDRLRQLIEEFDQHSVVGEAANGQHALQSVSDLKPDVVLLDIRMPGLGGIEVAHHLNRLESPPAVVFTTAYDEYAIQAFEANAIGYVLKPVRRERLLQALDQAGKLSSAELSEVVRESGLPERREHVCARFRDKLKLIPRRDIYYFSADQKYVCVRHTGGEDLIDESLKALEQEFSDTFVRIHRGALVAVEQIESLKKTADGHTVVVLRDEIVEGDDGLTISRRHLSDVRRRLKKG